MIFARVDRDLAPLLAGHGKAGLGDSRALNPGDAM